MPEARFDRPDGSTQGDLTDPLYMDFISYSQYAALSNAMAKGEQVFTVSQVLSYTGLIHGSLKSITWILQFRSIVWNAQTAKGLCDVTPGSQTTSFSPTYSTDLLEIRFMMAWPTGSERRFLVLPNPCHQGHLKRKCLRV